MILFCIGSGFHLISTEKTSLSLKVIFFEAISASVDLYILSDKFSLECDVPQRSCLGPILIKLYTSKLCEIFKLICLMFIVMYMTHRFTFRLVLKS